MSISRRDFIRVSTLALGAAVLPRALFDNNPLLEYLHPSGVSLPCGLASACVSGLPSVGTYAYFPPSAVSEVHNLLSHNPDLYRDMQESDIKAALLMHTDGLAQKVPPKLFAESMAQENFAIKSAEIAYRDKDYVKIVLKNGGFHFPIDAENSSVTMSLFKKAGIGNLVLKTASQIALPTEVSPSGGTVLAGNLDAFMPGIIAASSFGELRSSVAVYSAKLVYAKENCNESSPAFRSLVSVLYGLRSGININPEYVTNSSDLATLVQQYNQSISTTECDFNDTTQDTLIPCKFEVTPGEFVSMQVRSQFRIHFDELMKPSITGLREFGIGVHRNLNVVGTLSTGEVFMISGSPFMLFKKTENLAQYLVQLQTYLGLKFDNVYCLDLGAGASHATMTDYGEILKTSNSGHTSPAIIGVSR
jgi:hypothetical protein